MSSHAYAIQKVLNNNVILGRQQEQGEVILIGKGIGFGKKTGKEYIIDEHKIEKVFLQHIDHEKDDYMSMIRHMDYRIIAVGEEIIQMAKKTFQSLNAHIYVALTDHIGFTLERIKQGMVIHNPFLYEIKSLYKEEFQVGCQAKVLIKMRLGVTIPDDEVGFIALHIHSARQNKKVKDTVKHTRLIQKMVTIVEQDIGGNIDRDKILYSRLIKHLRQCMERVDAQKSIVNPLLDDIKVKLKEAYTIALKVGSVLHEENGIHVPEDELAFMALHIERLKESIN
ncbi:PRD domain-containing protein [Vallitalea pronyensis]|uniref:PRD domain-containing protein n=1 Tax=Vallitalea pronyensis TaxID=1348613 RepID=A0A8J8SGH4_9FIRM|nr:PRD domain-containing protein [Vallitalea pronyensis]QUI22394.1 PRD domain-containing protein [Vallitalea pronyensis]